MTRAISRDSFNELKQYIGVHLQQGRVLLDSDWNEGQDIMATLARRLGQDAFGDGVLGQGFEIQPVIPSPWKPGSQDLFELSYFQGHLPVSLRSPPTAPFDAFESADGWTLTGTGKLRISRDRPYEGRAFLRLSDHTGEVTVSKTLSSPADLSDFQYGHFRFRLNQTANVPSGAAKFFIEDINGNRNMWPLTAPWAAKERWFPGAALPLDLRFHLFDIDLLPALRNRSYSTPIPTFPTTSAVNSGVVFSITSGSLPAGLSLVQSTGHATPYHGVITGTPTQAGTFTFTVSAATGGTTVTRSFTLIVLEDPATTPPSAELQDLSGTTGRALDFWKMVYARPTTSGTAANLSSIKRYGFIISQPGAAPAVWDFDALYFGSRSRIHTKASNDFVIGGPTGAQVLDLIANSFQVRDTAEADDSVQTLTALSQLFTGTPRAFVGGYACTQLTDTLYSDQRDRTDPAITTPTSASVRRDLVYLDVTREPVTYIDDPDLREIALGGPDTSTRTRIRQRVRVALGGSLPSDGGIGGGTLLTEGNYTDLSNRLYLVQVDTAGDIGSATVRWSDDNASTLQRVIETVPPGSTKIKVEDASAFRAGDLILLRKEFTDEEHRVASVVGNTISLQEATGASTTFALADRPRIQRWNAFRTPISPDSNDPTMSAPINLSFGVTVRIGGRALKKGDFWTFRTRYLSGDAASGVNSVSRIEPLDFQSPQGVVHHYAPLALIVRDPKMPSPDRVQVIHDLRRRAGQIVHHQQSVSLSTPATITSSTTFDNFLSLGSIGSQSSFLCFWSGVAQSDPVTNVDGRLTITIDFFGRELTLPSATDGQIGTGATFTISYDGTETLRNVFSFIPRPPGPGVIAVRAKYTTTRVHEAASQLKTTVTGTLNLIEFKNPMQSIATFPFDL